jgi:hypothetical protein
MMGLRKQGRNSKNASGGIKDGRVPDKTGHSSSHHIEHGSVVPLLIFKNLLLATAVKAFAIKKLKLLRC